MAARKKRRADGLATRERIIASATTMFAASGYEGTSLRQIAASASIDIATLKYHYGDKATLFAQVYSQGHAVFVSELAPILEAFAGVNTQEELRPVLRLFSARMHDFVAGNLSFIKLTLFRIIEENVETIDVEDDLQVAAIGILSEAFAELGRRGVICDVDTRALSAFLISSFLTWHVLARTKPEWVGDPHIDSDPGRARSEDFFVATLERILGVG